MNRRRFGFVIDAATVLSVLLCVGVATLWVRSFWFADFVSYKRILRPGVLQMELDSIRGSIHFGYLRTPAALPADETPGVRFEATPAGQVRVTGGRWGFGYESRTDVGFAYREVRFPHALAVAALAGLAVRWLVYNRRLKYRLSRGLCASCGYDVRATPQEGGALLEKCPECGAAANV